MTQEDAISALQARIKAFSQERDWDQFHTPKNLIMAATSEMGELAEVLQWKNDEEAAEFLASQYGRERISEEIADGFIVNPVENISGSTIISVLPERGEISVLK
jgi:NTP pyrophosphatase (non-canonical NTP hydrolase)